MTEDETTINPDFKRFVLQDYIDRLDGSERDLSNAHANTRESMRLRIEDIKDAGKNATSCLWLGFVSGAVATMVILAAAGVFTR